MQRSAILVVDDEPVSLRAVMRTLQAEHRVLITESPAQALSILGAEPIAILISDQRMAEMLGTELLARTAQMHAHVMRILLTGYTDVELLVEAINAGHVYSYVTKPWEPGALRLIVRRALERFEVEADRRRLLGELQESCAQLQRESERQSRLLALAAHELRTPVHLLSNALDLLSEAPLPSSPSPWLQTARQASDWLGRCVRQLHVASRWQSSAPALNLQTVGAAPLIADLIERFAAVCARRRLSLSVGVVAPQLDILCDATWMTHALGCLLSNAIRFTPDGGSMRVSAQATVSGVTITVDDTGIGIAPELIEHVFEPFSPACGDVQEHGSGAFEFGARGLGLGLSTAKAIVEAHGGRITVQSTPGRGSSFIVHLPPPVRTAASLAERDCR